MRRALRLESFGMDRWICAQGIDGHVERRNERERDEHQQQNRSAICFRLHALKLPIDEFANPREPKNRADNERANAPHPGAPRTPLEETGPCGSRWQSRVRSATSRIFECRFKAREELIAVGKKPHERQ